MHEFQQFADQLDRVIRSDSVTERRRDDEWNVGLHVLGRRMSIVAADLHSASEFLRGWRRRWCNYVRHPDTDAATAPELRSKQPQRGTKGTNGFSNHFVLLCGNHT